jgi:long-chain acyl-CoA synthetase
MANLLLPLSVGAKVVFLESISSTTLLEALQARGITIFACVPQFFYLIHQRVTGEVAKGGAVARGLFRALVNSNAWMRDRLGWNPGRRVFARVHRVLGPKMRILVTGGSRFDPAIGRDLYGLGFTLLNAYGLTETSGGAAIVRPGDRFTTSVGQPFPGVEIRIASASESARPGAGAPVDGADERRGASGVPASESARRGAGDPVDGEDGEVLIRGPVIMREYFQRPDATTEALRDGWLYTGDLGRLDDEGRLYITGRKKEIIVLSSGKNLYPEEIEAHYRQSSFVGELCVLGLAQPGAPAAERLHAVIVPDPETLRERGIVNLRELARFELEGLSVQLPAHKRILTFDVWTDPLPRTTTGKIKRHEVERRVREDAASGGDEADRPLTDAETQWLAEPAHEQSVAAIAARLERETVRPDDNLELELGLDSMERVELLTTLERRQGTRVAAESRAGIFTVRGLVEAVLAAPADGDTAVEPADTDLAWDTLLREPPDQALIDDLSKPKFIRAAVLFVLFRLAALPARVLLGFRATGQAHLPAGGPFIICPNHQTYLDGALLVAALPFRVFRQLFLVGAAEYFERPFMRWLAVATNIVPVDPNANLITAMRAGAAGLRLEKVLILFPEGERSIDGEMKIFRKGAAILSSHLDAPIVPVALDGLFPIWPRGRSLNWRALLPWRAQRVRFEFGPPIGVTRGAYDEGTATLRRAVEEMFEAMRQRR